jgi:hypothetical protein
VVHGKISFGGRIEKKNVKYVGKMQSFGVTDGVLCSKNLCFKA